jgi:hypothetical protein
MSAKANGQSYFDLSNKSEATQIAEAWLKRVRPMLDPIIDSIKASAEAGCGDDLMLWHTTLSGLVGDIANILTHEPVVVVPDVKPNA